MPAVEGLGQLAACSRPVEHCCPLLQRQHIRDALRVAKSLADVDSRAAHEIADTAESIHGDLVSRVHEADEIRVQGRLSRFVHDRYETIAAERPAARELIVERQRRTGAESALLDAQICDRAFQSDLVWNDTQWHPRRDKDWLRSVWLRGYGKLLLRRCRSGAKGEYYTPGQCQEQEKPTAHETQNQRHVVGSRRRFAPTRFVVVFVIVVAGSPRGPSRKVVVIIEIASRHLGVQSCRGSIILVFLIHSSTETEVLGPDCGENSIMQIRRLDTVSVVGTLPADIPSQ